MEWSLAEYKKETGAAIIFPYYGCMEGRRPATTRSTYILVEPPDASPGSTESDDAYGGTEYSVTFIVGDSWWTSGMMCGMIGNVDIAVMVNILLPSTSVSGGASLAKTPRKILGGSSGSDITFAKALTVCATTCTNYLH